VRSGVSEVAWTYFIPEETVQVDVIQNSHAEVNCILHTTPPGCPRRNLPYEVKSPANVQKTVLRNPHTRDEVRQGTAVRWPLGRDRHVESSPVARGNQGVFGQGMKRVLAVSPRGKLATTWAMLKRP